MPTIAASDPRLHWAGAVHVEHGPEGSVARRLDPADDPLYHEGLREKLHCAAGIRLRFATEATRIAGRLGAHTSSKPVACTVDGELVATSAPIEDAETFVLDGLPAGRKTLELWLPHTTPDWCLRELELDADIAPGGESGQPKWVHYGSSISHCGAADHPAGTWPAVAARRGGLDLTCFGVGGQCHLDHLMARQIRDRAADVISLKLGINIQGASSLNERTFGPGIVGFVRLLRERHHEIPIVVLSPICSPPREQARNLVGLDLERMRGEVEAAVEALRSWGDQHVHYLDGRELFAQADADAGLLPDDLHPNHAGYQLMGERFHRLVIERWFR